MVEKIKYLCKNKYVHIGAYSIALYQLTSCVKDLDTAQYDIIQLTPNVTLSFLHFDYTVEQTILDNIALLPDGTIESIEDFSQSTDLDTSEFTESPEQHLDSLKIYLEFTNELTAAASGELNFLGADDTAVLNTPITINAGTDGTTRGATKTIIERTFTNDEITTIGTASQVQVNLTLEGDNTLQGDNLKMRSYIQYFINTEVDLND